MIYYFFLACVHLNSTHHSSSLIGLYSYKDSRNTVHVWTQTQYVWCTASLYIHQLCKLNIHLSVFYSFRFQPTVVLWDIKLPAVSDTLTIHSSEAIDVCVHVFFYTWFSQMMAQMTQNMQDNNEIRKFDIKYIFFIYMCLKIMLHITKLSNDHQ